MMSMHSCRRLEDQEEKSFSELEVEFLESIEHSRIPSLKSIANRRHCRESMAERVHGLFVQWRDRWRTQLEQLKDQLAHKLVCCCGHDLNMFTDEDEYDQLQVLDKRSDATLARKDTAAKSLSSIAPFSVAIQRPDDMQAKVTADFAPVESCSNVQLDDISCVLSNVASVSYELDAAIKIQRVFHARSASSKYLRWKKECAREASKARANASFARVGLVLSCLIVMEKLGEKHRSSVAASIIQHKWRRVQHVSKIESSSVSDIPRQSEVIFSCSLSPVN
ncbi:hypothetical protein FI667_g6697, partial [Globisporangium splendens]